MTKPKPDPIDDPRVEFAALQTKQWKALDRGIYFVMTAQEAQEYEQRGRWIVELQRALGSNLNIPPPKKPA